MPETMIDRSGAEALIPEEMSQEIFAEAAQQSIVMSMAHKLPAMSRTTRRLPVMSALPIAYFVDEAPGDGEGSSLKRTSKAEWEKVFLNVAEIAVIVPIPESVLADSAFDIWGEIRPHIAEAIGIKFDAAVLYGTDAPSDWPDDLVSVALAAGNSVALGTGTDLYDDILGANGLISKLEVDGYFPNGYVGAMSLRGMLRGLRADGLPIFKALNREGIQGATQYELDGVPVRFPTSGVIDPTASLLLAADWNKIVWAPRTDITTKLLTEAVIQDPADGSIIYNLAQQDMVALRVTTRLAWALPNPINRIQPIKSNRAPVAVLTGAVSP